jgi:signal transduction histidine kinase
LLSNAVKFTPDAGRVAVDLLLDECQGIVIKITDTGIGIAPQHITKVFQPFFQVADSLTRNHEGTGLGLYLCKTLAERNGATLAIGSALGQGTTVTLRFAPDRTVPRPPS